MEPFGRLTAVAVPLDVPNVDTDRIVPARFLRKPRSAGYGQFLFHDAGFALDRPEYRGARILVAAENFGCGSSREAAVWALAGAGFRAVVAPSFGDIFAENCPKNGLLAVVLPSDVVAALMQALHRDPGAPVTIDLPAQTLTAPDGTGHRFELDLFGKQCLVDGLDEIGVTLRHEAAIVAFEVRRTVETPGADPTPGA